MKNLLWIFLFIGVVSCAKSHEQQRYDDLKIEIQNLKLKEKPLAKECEGIYANIVKAQEVGNDAQVIEYGKKGKVICTELTELDKKIMDLTAESMRLYPYIKH